MHDAQQHAERGGWEVVDTFEDVNISAFSTKAKRPEFERPWLIMTTHLA